MTPVCRGVARTVTTNDGHDHGDDDDGNTHMHARLNAPRMSIATNFCVVCRGSTKIKYY